jgi:uncharacterized membrane protein YsdA (DUF1294 family)
MEWIIYLFLINITSYLVMGYDKKRARAKKFRVSERNLFLLTVIGGSIGTYMGMKQHRHKTKHQTFTVGVPLILSLQIILAAFILLRY